MTKICMATIFEARSTNGEKTEKILATYAYSGGQTDLINLTQNYRTYVIAKNLIRSGEMESIPEPNTIATPHLIREHGEERRVGCRVYDSYEDFLEDAYSRHYAVDPDIVITFFHPEENNWLVLCPAAMKLITVDEYLTSSYNYSAKELLRYRDLVMNSISKPYLRECYYGNRRDAIRLGADGEPEYSRDELLLDKLRDLDKALGLPSREELNRPFF